MEDSCGRGLVCFTEWYKHGHLVYLPWAMVFSASPYAVFSLVALIMGMVEVSTFPTDYVPQPDSPRKKGRMAKGALWFWLNALCALIWAGFVGLAVYLVLEQVWIMLAYAIWGGVACCFHTAIAMVLRHRGRQVVKGIENSRYLAPQQSDKQTEQPDDVPLVLTQSQPSDAPFVTTFGVIPGTTERSLQFQFQMPRPSQQQQMRPMQHPRHPGEPSRSPLDKQGKYTKV